MQTRIPSLTPVICGPTAGGKSDLAVTLALTLRENYNIPAEIVTADAFQVYTGLNIGTAKPTLADRRGVPHHLIDIVPSPSCPPLGTPPLGTPPVPGGSSFSPSAFKSTPAGDRRATQPFTLDDWLARANSTIADLRSRHIIPIVVGGTHLYIKALLEGLFDGPEPDHQLRAQLSAMDPAARRAELERVDPLAAQRIHPNDIRRTIRALEIFKLTGKPISAHQKQWDRSTEAPPSETRDPKPETRFLLITLDWDPDALNKRINARVRQMMEHGLLHEVRTLVESGGFTPQSAEALGYKQLIPLVQAAIHSHSWPPPTAALEEAVEKIKIETRRFGKNQRTWLRRLSTTPGTLRLAAPAPDSSTALPSPKDPSPTTWLQQILAALNLPT